VLLMLLPLLMLLVMMVVRDDRHRGREGRGCGVRSAAVIVALPRPARLLQLRL
jgi:hypothetical protein